MDEELQASQRWLAATMLEDSRLRSHLDDAQASLLLHWGLGRLGNRARRLAETPQQANSEKLETYADQLRLLMRLINQLAQQLRETPKEADPQLQAKIVQTIRRITPDDRKSRQQTGQIRALLQESDGRSPETFVEALIRMLAELP